MNTVNDYRKFIVANHTMSKSYKDPDLITSVEAFLFQSKSCLDIFAQLIAYSFKFQISSYQDNGNGLLRILDRISVQNDEDKNNISQLIKQSVPWVKELVEMRDEVAHFSDLEGLSCFLIKQCNGSDLVVKVFYPAMPSGERVSGYMDKTWNNICALIDKCRPLLVRVAKNN